MKSRARYIDNSGSSMSSETPMATTSTQSGSVVTGEWMPSMVERRDTVSVAAATALHDLLDTGGTPPRLGDRLPMLWHWLAFLPQARQSDLGPDGHPVTGSFLPPTDGRQRMYAGGHVTVTKPPRIGDPLTRKSTVTDVQHKSGRSGELMFVTVEHTITSPTGELGDRNDIVYKSPAPARTPTNAGTSSPRPAADETDTAWEWDRSVDIEPALLFRFSALTYNAHRIHYDRDYAVNAEGYPGLVVHGPLQAILLADALTLVLPNHRPTSFTFRSTAPAFDNCPLELRYRSTNEPGVAELAAFSNGKQTMTATAVLTPETRRP
ncbi:MaoC family dehydratase N-terminal domain-containing protein [Paenarthrobacter sp. NPDC090520]|uniref:FAS1-like dehydratase domain-containing protein n=1 Tax=unclassified Paenarthrobacter TaxID=2634190 RepID=UPI0038112C36